LRSIAAGIAGGRAQRCGGDDCYAGLARGFSTLITLSACCRARCAAALLPYYALRAAAACRHTSALALAALLPRGGGAPRVTKERATWHAHLAPPAYGQNGGAAGNYLYLWAYAADGRR